MEHRIKDTHGLEECVTYLNKMVDKLKTGDLPLTAQVPVVMPSKNEEFSDTEKS